jgi:protein ImuA
MIEQNTNILNEAAMGVFQALSVFERETAVNGDDDDRRSSVGDSIPVDFGRAGRLASLKDEIAAIAPNGTRGGNRGLGRDTGRAGEGIMPFGIPAIDRLLPHGGLDRGALHAVLAGDCRDMPAALGFAAALAARFAAGRGPILWVGQVTGGARGLADFGGLYGPGLLSLGLDPDRLILASVQRQDDMLWALEQGLGCPDLALVVGEVDPGAPLSLTAARRLQLAAARSGVTALAVGGHAGREDGLVAAVTRWCVAAAPAPDPDFSNLPARQQRFEVALSARGTRPGHWCLDWSAREKRFSLSERGARSTGERHAARAA